MNTQTVIAVLCIICFYLWKKSQKPTEEEEEPEELEPFFDSARLQNEVKALYSAMKEITELDEMIVDLRLCKPEELHKAFRVQWNGITGKQHALDFMSTGTNAATENFMELAANRREELNADIQARIIDLYNRAQHMEYYLTCDIDSKKAVSRSYQICEHYDAEGEYTA